MRKHLRSRREIPLEAENKDFWTFALVTAMVLYLLLSLTALNAQTMPQLASQPGSQADPAPLPRLEPRTSIAQKLDLVKPGLASNSLAAYLARVRAENSSAQPTPGSIWSDSGRLTRMNTDVRAMRPNDLISVVVSENLNASTDGTVKNSRASNASSQITSLFGLLKAGNALQNLVGQTSTLGLNAQGTSATNSSLTTILGGQVVEVLANGTLVVEAERQVEFSQQTQTIVLRGLVRPEDISQQNQVLSTAIASLELEVKGKGIVNDATYRQNPLVRLLERIIIF